MRIRTLLAAAAALTTLLTGCASAPGTSPVIFTDNACTIMAPHMPQRVWSADTAQTKKDALQRNAAWRVLCPPATPGG